MIKGEIHILYLFFLIFSCKVSAQIFNDPVVLCSEQIKKVKQGSLFEYEITLSNKCASMNFVSKVEYQIFDATLYYSFIGQVDTIKYFTDSKLITALIFQYDSSQNLSSIERKVLIKGLDSRKYYPDIHKNISILDTLESTLHSVDIHGNKEKKVEPLFSKVTYDSLRRLTITTDSTANRLDSKEYSYDGNRLIEINEYYSSNYSSTHFRRRFIYHESGLINIMLVTKSIKDKSGSHIVDSEYEVKFKYKKEKR